MDKRLFLVLIAVIYFTVFLIQTVYANSQPNATIPNITGYENTNITFNVSATDSDGDPLTYSSDDPNVVWNSTDLYYVTDYDTVIHPNLTKTIVVNVTADDGLLNCTQEVNVTVLDVNRPPYYWCDYGPNYTSICYQYQYVPEDSPPFDNYKGVNVSNFFVDPDGDPWTYEFVSPYYTQNNFSDFTGQPCNFTIDENGYLDVEILENFDGYCSASFLNAVDPYGLTPVDEPNNGSGVFIQFQVIPSDDPPIFIIPDVSGNESTIIDFNVPEKDIDGDVLTYDIDNNLSVIWNGTDLYWNATFDDVQHPAQNIIHTINVTVTDGMTNNSQLVNITILDVNRPSYYWCDYGPNYTSICYQYQYVPEDSPPFDNYKGVNVSNFFVDPDGDPWTYEFVSPYYTQNNFSDFTGQPCNFTIDENGYLDVEIIENFDGYCSASFLNAVDPYGLTPADEPNNGSGVFIQFQVIPSNDAPILNATLPTITFNEDEYNDTWNPASYFIDYESNPIFFSILNSTNINTDNITWNFTASIADWFGEENLTLTATDNMNDTTINLTVKVLPVNDRPTINQISNISENETEMITITPTATDVDGDLLAFNTNNLDLVWNATLSAFEWTPDYYDYGNHTINMTVSDTLLDDSTVFNIEVLRKRYGFSIDLIWGWNFISTPYALDNTTVASIMSDISSNHTIWAYNSSTDSWQDYDSTRPQNLNNLTNIPVGQGFWINISGNETLTVTGTRSPETNITLNKGWNMISYPLDAKTNINDTLSVIYGKYDIVWQYNASDEKNWTLYNPLPPQASPANTLHVFTPGYSYWINMTEAADLIFSY